MFSPVKCSNTQTFTMYTYNKRHTFSLTVLVRLFSYRFSWRKEIYTVTALPFITFLLLMWWKNIMAEEQKKDVRFYAEHSQYNRNISSFWLLSFHEAVIVVHYALMLRAPLFFFFHGISNCCRTSSWYRQRTGRITFMCTMEHSTFYIYLLCYFLCYGCTISLIAKVN